MDFLRIQQEGTDYTAEVIALQDFSDGATVGPRKIVGHFIKTIGEGKEKQTVIQVSKEMQKLSIRDMQILSIRLSEVVGPMLLSSP